MHFNWKKNVYFYSVSSLQLEFCIKKIIMSSWQLHIKKNTNVYFLLWQVGMRYVFYTYITDPSYQMYVFYNPIVIYLKIE